MKKLLGAAFGLFGLPWASGQTVSPPEELFLTVEPGGTALVREVRSAQLVEGSNNLQAYETSPRLIPSSVHLRSLNHPQALRLLQQSLWFEVLDEERLLELLVGQEVDLLLERALRTEQIEGRLLLPPWASSPQGERRVPLFIETLEGDIRVVEGGELTLDTLPEGKWNRVRLDWELETTTAGRHRLELCYRTEGIGLEIAYTLRLNEEGDRADLLGMASLRNDTGHTFAEARLQFSLPDATPRGHWDEKGGVTRALYPVRDPVRLEARRTKEVSLVHALGVTVRRRYSVFPERHPAGRANRDGLIPVRRCYDLDTRSELGFPPALPPGQVETYRLDAERRVLREAASHLDGTVLGETLSFAGAPLPGVVVARFTTRGSDDSGPNRSVQLRFHNERREAVAVQILEPLGVREVARCDAARVDLSRPGWALIHVDVPSESSSSVRYRVEIE